MAMTAGRSDAAALEVASISKTFGATRALVDVSFAVKASSVHGLLGENGSGKSTLVKILSGYHAPDSGGHLSLWGEPVKLPIRAGGHHEIGMGFVHQTLGLAEALSVAENLLIDEVTRPRRLAIRWRAARARAGAILAEYGLELDPSRSAGSLSRSERAMLAIVRAVHKFTDGDAAAVRRGLLVLDEPSASFTVREKEWLYGAVRAFTGAGGAVLLISHDIDEIFEITDSVTVLRDGHVQATVPSGSVTGSELAELIVGRHLASSLRGPLQSGDAAPALMRVRRLSGGGVAGVDFDLHAGEVVGLTGLAGSGFEDVLPLVFGAVGADSGTMELAGRTHGLMQMTPQAAMALGVAMVPDDRERGGCVLELSVTDNVTLCSLPEYRTRLGLNRARMSAVARSEIAQYGIRAPHASAPVGTLSGGNQQKVLLGKWLATHPRVLLLHEPTVGLDVGARLDIFMLIRSVARQGTSVICASADWDQLAEICDRVIIFANGRVASTITSADLSETAIGHECYRVSTQSAVAAGSADGSLAQ